MGVERKKVLNRNFGTNEFGFADLPVKISGIKIRRFQDDMGCDLCFPHGEETSNGTSAKNWNDKSWKRYRCTQYKNAGEHSVYEHKHFDEETKRWMINNWKGRQIQFNGYSNIHKRRKGKWKQQESSSSIDNLTPSWRFLTKNEITEDFLLEKSSYKKL